MGAKGGYILKSYKKCRGEIVEAGMLQVLRGLI